MTDIQAQLAAFAERFAQQFSRERPDTFYTGELDLRSLIANGSFPAIINRALESIRDRPYAAGNWTLHQIVLAQGPAFALSLALVDARTRYLHSSPFLAMYAPADARPLTYTRYRLPPNHNNAVFDASARLAPAGTGALSPGDILHVHPEGELIDFEIESPRLILKLTSSAWHVLEWLFDRGTLKAVQANDAALVTTQLRVASYLLGRLGHASSIEPLKQLASHNTPNVRWAGIQNLGRLSVTDARAALAQALEDPHPHIRRAARKSLGLGTETAQG